MAIPIRIVFGGGKLLKRFIYTIFRTDLIGWLPDLFGPYVLGVELASILLTAGLVGAYHLARPEPSHPIEGERP